jgi:HSP20 family protein
MPETMTLRDVMDRLFDEASTRPWGMAGGGREAGIAAMDMYKTDDEVVVKLAGPGMKPEDAQITATGDMLSIKGESHEKPDAKDRAFHLRERR